MVYTDNTDAYIHKIQPTATNTVYITTVYVLETYIPAELQINIIYHMSIMGIYGESTFIYVAHVTSLA